MLKSLRGIWIIALLGNAPAIHASLLSWNIVNLSFDDGATANGRFTLNTNTNLVTDFDITTTGGTILSGFQYNNTTARITGQANDPGSGWPSDFLQIDSVDGAFPGGTRELFLAFSGPLEPGGTAAILYSGTRPSYELQLGGETAGQRLVQGPGVVDPPVPEPSKLIFLGLALGLMGAYRVRRLRGRRAAA